jgi:hypothetical protein
VGHILLELPFLTSRAWFEDAVHGGYRDQVTPPSFVPLVSAKEQMQIDTVFTLPAASSDIVWHSFVASCSSSPVTGAVGQIRTAPLSNKAARCIAPNGHPDFPNSERAWNQVLQRKDGDRVTIVGFQGPGSTVVLQRQSGQQIEVARPGEAGIEADIKQARELKISGTPTFLIGVVEADGRLKVDRHESGAIPAPAFARMLDDVLKRTGPKSPSP